MVRWPHLTLADTAITLALAPRSSPWPFPLHLRALTARRRLRHLRIGATIRAPRGG